MCANTRTQVCNIISTYRYHQDVHIYFGSPFGHHSFLSSFSSRQIGIDSSTLTILTKFGTKMKGVIHRGEESTHEEWNPSLWTH